MKGTESWEAGVWSSEPEMRTGEAGLSTVADSQGPGSSESTGSPGWSQAEASLHGLAGVGMLVPGLVHELNNLLTGALGFTHLLAQGVGTEAKRKSMLETVQGELNRCATLTRELLTWARAQRLSAAPFDLTALVSSTFEAFLLDQGEPVLGAIFALEPIPAMVLGVELQVRQVLLALLALARQTIGARAGMGIIQVSLTHEDAGFRLELVDEQNGAFALEKADVMSPGGTAPGPNLTLAITRSVLKELGGRVMLIREEEKSGVQLYFPRARLSEVPSPGRS